MTDTAAPASDQTALVEMTTEVIAAYVAQNHVQAADMPALIASVHAAFAGLGKPHEAGSQPDKLAPPVSIKKSITNDYLVSMEDGKRYQALKRHLTKLGLTPAEYRAKWGLSKDYPMVAPGYSARRSELAKTLGLGRKAATAVEQPEPAEAPAKPKAGRPKKGAA